MIKKIFAIYIIAFTILAFALPVFAANCQGYPVPDDLDCTEPINADCVGAGCSNANINISAGNALSGHTSTALADFVSKITRNLLIIAFIIAPLLVLYGGITILLSRGNPDKLTKGKSIIFWSLIGLAVFLAAKIISNVIITAFAS